MINSINPVEPGKPDVANDVYMSKRQVADLLKVSTRTIESYMEKGILPFFKLGGTVRFRRDLVNTHLATHYMVNSSAATGRVPATLN